MCGRVEYDERGRRSPPSFISRSAPPTFQTFLNAHHLTLPTTHITHSLGRPSFVGHAPPHHPPQRPLPLGAPPRAALPLLHQPDR